MAGNVLCRGKGLMCVVVVVKEAHGERVEGLMPEQFGGWLFCGDGIGRVGVH